MLKTSLSPSAHLRHSQALPRRSLARQVQQVLLPQGCQLQAVDGARGGAQRQRLPGAAAPGAHLLYLLPPACFVGGREEWRGR